MGKPAVFPDPFGIPTLSLPPAAAQNAARILTAKRRAGAFLCVRCAAPPANRGLEGDAYKRGCGVQGNLTVQPARPALLRAGHKVGYAPGREPPGAQQHGGAGDHSQIGRKSSPKTAPFLKRYAALRDCGNSHAPRGARLRRAGVACPTGSAPKEGAGCPEGHGGTMGSPMSLWPLRGSAYPRPAPVARIYLRGQHAPCANRGLEGGACKRGRGVQGNLTVQPARPARLRAGYKVGCAPGREPQVRKPAGAFAKNKNPAHRRDSQKCFMSIRRQTRLRAHTVQGRQVRRP